MYVCGNAFRLGDADSIGDSGATFWFDNMKLGLAAGDTRVVRIGYDDVAPSLVDEAPLALAGAVLTLTFDEALDTGSVPDASAFTVEEEGVAIDLATANAVAVSASTVTLTLAAAPAATAQAVAVSYTAGTNPLRDPQQNNVADFSETLSLNSPPTGKPAITGVARVGATLTADISGIMDADGLTKSDANESGFEPVYQWVEVDGSGESSIPNANSKTYVPGTTNAGKRLKVRVSVTDDKGNPEDSIESDETPVVLAMNAARGAPAISGFPPRVGDVVTADKGDITDADGTAKADAGDAGYAYQYQWIRVDGMTEEDIPNATSETYTLAAADVGKQIKVRAMFKDDAGNAEVSGASGGFPAIDFPNTVDKVLPAAVCNAPDTTGQRELWSATVTVEIFLDVIQGYIAIDGSQNIDRQLGDVSNFGPFTVPHETGQLNYTVTMVYNGVTRYPGSGVTTDLFYFEFQPGLNSSSADDINRLTLYVCGDRIGNDWITNSEHDGLEPPRWSRHPFKHRGEEWSTYSTRDVRLIWDVNPEFVSAKLDGTLLKLTFSEPLDANRVPAASVFTVESGGAAVALADIDPVAISGNTVTLTLGSTPAATATVTVNYEVPLYNGLADLRGLLVQDFSSAKSVTNNVPILQTAEIGTDGATLTLTYDEALDTASVPASSAFGVKVNTVAAPLATATPVSISDKTVVLNLATPAREGETVTLTYTKPSTNPIQDSDGNDAASLTDEPVTNSSTLNATGKPEISGGPRVGEELTAEKGTIADANGLTKAEAGDTGYAYEYQWIRVDGTTESDITGATAKTYTPDADDEGKKLKVRVSFKDDADNAEALVSDAVPDTGSILPMAVCEAPAYTGGAEEIWSGEMTIGNNGTGTFGFSNHAGVVYGTLTPEDEFTLGSTGYTIKQATQLVFRTILTYNLSVNNGFPAADIPRLVLHDCDTPLVASTASGGSNDLFSWVIRGSDTANFPNWSTYSSRTLRLSYDDTAPTVQSHELDGASLTLVFSEALDEGSVPPASAFDVEVDETDARINRVRIDDDTVTLTLAAAPAETVVVMLEYTPPSANPLRDPRSNQVQAFAIDEVGYLGPRLVSAKLDGTSLKLTFSEPLDETKVPAASAFTVQSGGADVDLANTGAVAVSGNTVTLILGTDARGHGDGDRELRKARLQTGSPTGTEMRCNPSQAPGP